MVSTTVRWVIVSATVGTLLAGCGEGTRTVYFADPDGGITADAGDAGDMNDADAGSTDPADASDEDAGPSCDGECVPLRPDGFSSPMLLWMGAEDQAPGCPAQAPVKQYTGHGQLLVPDATCPTCTCLPSAGTCGLPASFTAHTAACNLPGSDTSFDAPPGWDGTCSAANAIPAGEQCPPGSGIPCVYSLRITPLSVMDDGCTPAGMPDTPDTVPLPPPSWGLFAIACEGTPSIPCPTCGDPALTCVPAAPAGFRQCVHTKGDVVCPTEGYTERFLFYGEFKDERNCSDCACGPVQGSTCTATGGVYRDGTCSLSFLLLPLSSTGPSCTDLQPPGQALGSKAVMDVTYHAGTCEPSGGELSGSVEPTSPTTFCCLPEAP
jgi:hypothetical protein